MAKNNSPFHGMALTSAILAQLVGGPLVGLMVGRWLDHLLMTKPLFLILFLILGIVAGTYGTIRIVKDFTGEE